MCVCFCQQCEGFSLIQHDIQDSFLPRLSLTRLLALNSLSWYSVHSLNVKKNPTLFSHNSFCQGSYSQNWTKTVAELFPFFTSLWSPQLGRAARFLPSSQKDFFPPSLTSQTLSDAKGQAVLGPLDDATVVEDHAGQHHPFSKYHWLVCRLLGEVDTPHCNRGTENKINFKFLSLWPGNELPSFIGLYRATQSLSGLIDSWLVLIYIVAAEVICYVFIIYMVFLLSFFIVCFYWECFSSGRVKFWIELLAFIHICIGWLQRQSET